MYVCAALTNDFHQVYKADSILEVCPDVVDERDARLPPEVVVHPCSVVCELLLWGEREGTCLCLCVCDIEIDR